MQKKLFTSESVMVLVMGEITAKETVNYDQVVRDTIRRIGYTDSEYGFNADSVAVLISLNNQSPDIAQGVSKACINFY